MTPAALIFDFDGVILDSVDIKTRAFRHLFAAEEAPHIEEIVALHRRLGGISRYVKFDLIHERILKRELDGETRAELGRRFERYVHDEMLKCPEIAGAREVLRAWSARVPLFVASGTPQEELREIAQARGLAGYFTQMHGSPRGKPEIIAGLVRDHGLAAEQCLFIGDAISDFEAARASGVPFLGIVAPGLDNPFAGDVAVIPDLTQFDPVLSRGIRRQELQKGET